MSVPFGIACKKPCLLHGHFFVMRRVSSNYFRCMALTDENKVLKLTLKIRDGKIRYVYLNSHLVSYVNLLVVHLTFYVRVQNVTNIYTVLKSIHLHNTRIGQNVLSLSLFPVFVIVNYFEISLSRRLFVWLIPVIKYCVALYKYMEQTTLGDSLTLACIQKMMKYLQINKRKK